MPKEIIDPSLIKSIGGKEIIDPSSIKSIGVAPPHSIQSTNATMDSLDKTPNILAPSYLPSLASQGIAKLVGKPEVALETPTVGSAIREAPDLLQMGLEMAGAGMGGGAGLMAGTLLGSLAQNKVREEFPQIFGEPTSVLKLFEDFTGIDTSTENFVMDDLIVSGGLAALGPAFRMARHPIQQYKAGRDAVARGAGKALSKTRLIEPLSPEQKAINKEIALKAINVPAPMVGYETMLDILSPGGKEEYLKSYTKDLKNATKDYFGFEFVDEETKIPKGTIKALRKLKILRGKKQPPPGAFLPEVTVKNEATIVMGQKFEHMRLGENFLYGQVDSLTDPIGFRLDGKIRNQLKAADIKLKQKEVFSGVPAVKESIGQFRDTINALLAQKDGTFKFKQLNELQKDLSGNLSQAVLQPLKELDTLGLVEQLRESIKEQIIAYEAISAKKTGNLPSILGSLEKANSKVSERYVQWPSEFEKLIAAETSPFWNVMERNAEMAARGKTQIGNKPEMLKSMRGITMSRMFKRATNDEGLIDPKKLLKEWNNAPGTQQWLGNQTNRKLMKQWLTAQAERGPKDIGKFFEHFWAYKTGNIIMNFSGVALGLTVSPKAALILPVNRVANQIWANPEFMRAALELQTVNPSSRRALVLQRKVLAGLAGGKGALVMANQEDQPVLVDPEYKIPKQRERGFRTSAQNIETDKLLQNTGKFGKTRPPGFGTLGKSRR